MSGRNKKTNPVKVFFTDLYKSIGEKFGLLEEKYNIYTAID